MAGQRIFVEDVQDFLDERRSALQAAASAAWPQARLLATDDERRELSARVGKPFAVVFPEVATGRQGIWLEPFEKPGASAGGSRYTNYEEDPVPMIRVHLAVRGDITFLRYRAGNLAEPAPGGVIIGQEVVHEVLADDVKFRRVSIDQWQQAVCRHAKAVHISLAQGFLYGASGRALELWKEWDVAEKQRRERVAKTQRLIEAAGFRMGPPAG